METDATTLGRSAIADIAAIVKDGVPIERQIIKLGEYTYARNNKEGGLYRVDLDPWRPESVKFATLLGLVGFLANEPAAKEAVVHVDSPTKVRVLGPLIGQDKSRRNEYAVAEWRDPEVAGFRFDAPVGLEQLAIALQTCFEPGKGDIEALRQFCAGVRGTSESGVADDGVSQTVSAKAGIASISTVPVRNPWQLAPYRTFPELTQPISPFVLRFPKAKEGEPISGGLYRTGNALWYNEGVAAVRDWLKANISTHQVIG